jgi:methionyl-tRNA synthetase
MLLSASMPLPRAIFVHGHITVDGQKMSKTLGNIIDPVALVKKYGVDAVRYYLLRDFPPTDDGDFSYAKFEERYNADLANGLGNFCARVLTLAERDANIRMHANDTNDANIVGKISETKKKIEVKMGEYKFHEALAALWDLIAFGDKYFNERKPWDKTEDVKHQEETLRNANAIVVALGDMLMSFLPATAEKIGRAKKTILFPRIK